ncbi:hypothetical protein ACQJBY_003990 [Aegilops geniculata]
MPPFNGHCNVPEQQMEVGVITVAEKRCGHNKAAQREVQRSSQDEDVKNVRLIPPADSKRNGKRSSSGSMSSEDDLSQAESGTTQPPLKRLSRGPRAVVRNNAE